MQKSLCMGYIKPELAQPGTEIQVEILDERLPAKVIEMPVYDPKMERMKA